MMLHCPDSITLPSYCKKRRDDSIQIQIQLTVKNHYLQKYHIISIPCAYAVSPLYIGSQCLAHIIIPNTNLYQVWSISFQNNYILYESNKYIKYKLLNAW